MLEFELVDTTLAADDPLQSEGTRQLAPLLRGALAARGFGSMEIDAAAVAAAERGVGYLFDRPELAAPHGAARLADGIAATLESSR